MVFFAAFLLSLVMTMMLIPLLMQIADRLHLIDEPNTRKIHAAPIPRVGGIGMVLGIIIPVLIWVPLEREVLALLSGIGILFVFGVWDDSGDLDYRLKFLGQILATLIVVFYGDVIIRILPFFGMDPVPLWISIPFTTIVLVTVTNAVNLADGLDGLAAGTMLLSLAGVAVLYYLAGGADDVLTVLIVMGAITGFLRFNTFPARIFMGDTGSQFLGFTAAVLLIILTQKINTALNPAIPLLLLGLPVFDTIYVACKRIYRGKSPFSPDKNHTHHQLLGLGIDHYEAVVIIYLVQAFFVLCGILFRYNSDLFVVGLWLSVNIALMLILFIGAKSGWRLHSEHSHSRFRRWITSDNSRLLAGVSQAIIWIAIPLFLISGVLMTRTVELDIAITAAVLFGLLLLRLIFGLRLQLISLRLLLYVAVAFVVYLLQGDHSDTTPLINTIYYIYFGFIVIALVVGARYSIEDAFRVTPTDFLIVLFVTGLAVAQKVLGGGSDIIPMIIKMTILFYAIEMAMRNMRNRWNNITVSSLWAFGVIAVRGILL